MTTCTYHCRTCGGHFTSLRAFDSHRPRNPKDGGCGWPEGAELVESTGTCTISGPVPQAGVTIHGLPGAEKVAERFRKAAA